MSRRLQFSILQLLVATAVVAVAAGAFVAEMSWTVIITRVTLAFAFASCACWASSTTKGAQKLFWTGVAVPLVFGAFRSFQCFSSILHSMKSITLHADIEQELIAHDFLMVPILWCIAPVNGLLCIFVRWLIWPKPTESRP